MKVLIRILHFLLYFFVYMRKALFHKCHSMKQTFRYNVLWILHFSDSGILEHYANRITKTAGHSAIVVNKSGGRGAIKQELLKLGEVITWLVCTGSQHVTVFDKDGMIAMDDSVIQIVYMEVKRRLATQTVSIVADRRQQRVIDFTIKKNKTEEKNIRISFISGEDNVQALLTAIRDKKVEASTNKKLFVKESKEV